MATIFRPPVITRIEPASRWEAIRAVAFRVSLALLTAPAPALPVGSTDDFQNPIIKQGFENRTFNHRDQILLAVTPVQPPKCFDYPNPRGYLRSIDLLSFSLGEFPPLINQIGSPLLPFDWTNPLPPRRMIDLWNYLDQSTDILALSVPALPKNTEAFVPPPGFRRNPDLHNYTYNPPNLIGASPTQPSVLSFDYPNPRGAPHIGATIRSGSEQVRNFGMLVTTPVSVNQDFPNPRGREFSVELRTWIQSPDQIPDNTQPPSTWVVFQPYPNPWQAIFAQENVTPTSLSLQATPSFMPPAIWVEHQVNYRQPIDGLTIGVRPLSILAFSAPTPNIPVDQPNPRGAVPASDLRSFWNNNLTNTLIPVFPPQKNFDFPNTPRPGRVVDLNTLIQGLLPNITPSTGNPIFPVDQPNPRAPFFPFDLRFTSANLIDTTLFPVVPNVLNYDFPNPLGPKYPSDLRTFNLSQFKGIELYFGAPGQAPANLDWPNPLRPRQPNEHLSFANNGILDTVLFTVAYQPQTFDWPNPKGYGFPLENRTFLQNLTEFSPAQPSPFNLSDWPLTPAAKFSVDFRTWVQPLQFTASLPLQPFLAIIDNPRGAIFSVEFRTWNQNLQQTTLGGGSSHLFLNFDFPNPYQPRFSNELRTWTLNSDFNPNQTFFGDGQVFANLDWPNPRAPQRPSDLHSFTESARTFYAGIFFGASGQPPANQDWPVPKGRFQSIENRSYWYQLVSTTLNPGPPPPSSIYPDIINVSSIRIGL